MKHNTKRNIAIQNIAETLKQRGISLEYSSFGAVSGYTMRYNGAIIGDIVWNDETEHLQFPGGVIIPLFPPDKRKGDIYHAYKIGIDSVMACIRGENMTEVENRIRRILS